MMSKTYPIAGLNLPQIADHSWELRDGGNTRHSVGVWLTDRYGALITCAYAKPDTKSIEAAARKVAVNWQLWLALREQVRPLLPKVRNEPWEMDPIGVGSGSIELRLGEILGRHNWDSNHIRLNLRAILRVAKRMARRRERQYSFIEQNFDMPKLPAGQSWHVDFRGGVLPYTTVSLIDPNRYTDPHKIAGFTRVSVQRAAREIIGASVRNQRLARQLSTIER